MSSFILFQVHSLSLTFSFVKSVFAFSHFNRKKGILIHVASAAANFPIALLTLYSATKVQVISRACLFEPSKRAGSVSRLILLLFLLRSYGDRNWLRVKVKVKLWFLAPSAGIEEVAKR